MQVQGGADAAARAVAAEGAHGQPMRQGEVVGDGVGGVGVDQPGRVDAHLVTVLHHGLRLVDGEPVGDVGAETGEHGGRIVGEAVGGVAGLPAAAVLQHLRQVPVEQGRHRLDAALAQPVHDPAIEVEPALVHPA